MEGVLCHEVEWKECWVIKLNGRSVVSWGWVESGRTVWSWGPCSLPALFTSFVVAHFPLYQYSRGFVLCMHIQQHTRTWCMMTVLGHITCASVSTQAHKMTRLWSGALVIKSIFTHFMICLYCLLVLHENTPGGKRCTETPVWTLSTFVNECQRKQIFQSSLGRQNYALAMSKGRPLCLLPFQTCCITFALLFK